MIIAFTSDMIPRLVYYWSFSVYPYGNNPDHTMQGYINSSLSLFNINDFHNNSLGITTDEPHNISVCRYKKKLTHLFLFLCLIYILLKYCSCV